MDKTLLVAVYSEDGVPKRLAFDWEVWELLPPKEKEFFIRTVDEMVEDAKRDYGWYE